MTLALSSLLEMIKTTLSPAIEAMTFSKNRLSIASATTCAAAVVVLTTT